MHAVIRNYKVDAKNVDEIVRRAEAGFVPLISRAPGFVSYRLASGDNGEVITVSTFEDKRGADESVATAARWVKENLAELVPTPPQVISGTVRVRQVKSGEQPTYGVMRRYHGVVGSVTDMASQVERGFLPIVSTVPGFASYSLIDAGDGTVVTLSAFRDRTGADASTQKAAGWIKENMAKLLPNAPEVTRAEIRVSATTASTTTASASR
jgi:heme-degrading monooxygenase HmoA